MRKSAQTFVLLLLTAFLIPSKSEAQVFNLTEAQVRNIALAYDSLDECKEITDSLKSQVANCLSVVAASDTVISTLHSLNFNQGEIIKGKDIQLIEEKHVSSSLRNKYRLWKLAAIILAGINVYQIVR